MAAPRPPEVSSRLTPLGPELRLPGACEPSAAAWVEGALFVVEDDLPSALHRYSSDLTESALIPLTADGHAASLEDLEGAALGPEGLWILTSHSLTKGGKLGDRGLLGRVDLEGHVAPLLHNLRPTVGLDHWSQIFQDTGIEPAIAGLPGKEGGLDLEGLAWDPGGRLLLGLRRPLTAAGQAVIVAYDPVQDLLGPAWALDLGGRGIRDLALDPRTNTWLLLAGPSGGGASPTPTLFAWRPAAAPIALGTLPFLPNEDPEVLALDGETLTVAWDAGNRISGDMGKGEHCADLAARGYTRWAHVQRFHLDTAGLFVEPVEIPPP